MTILLACDCAAQGAKLCYKIVVFLGGCFDIQIYPAGCNIPEAIRWGSVDFDVSISPGGFQGESSLLQGCLDFGVIGYGCL